MTRLGEGIPCTYKRTLRWRPKLIGGAGHCQAQPRYKTVLARSRMAHLRQAALAHQLGLEGHPVIRTACAPATASAGRAAGESFAAAQRQHYLLQRLPLFAAEAVEVKPT